VPGLNCTSQTTGESRKEACPLSQPDAEKKSFVVTEGNAGVFGQARKFFEFLARVQEEMRLVHHPTLQEVRLTTIVVIFFVFLFAFYLHALDWMFAPLDHWLLNH
jgi:preprotein translocase SecE subunit